ncbi:exodeoxyribonuclease VII small subunit [Nakamurella flavida]|uniref:Exodeoxyribonuclease 7 small subunit n=1 Tax=Nakamurella flavida TaxID=363630 RepID=A0A939C3B3_9ACTN|nr:exodeoxyribonuclease VII small subunit [Nakamurella flavida]MBM9476896.1 exodeoxyribonuclease VII small subunit [Nakamurella flavida]MDP9779840.1 exodeoxyribonuclease VII small subunit [Nakamurella flavida]
MAATREPASPAPAADDGPTSYEQARDELAQVVARLEAGGLPLEESLTLWERGEHLAGVCTRLLDGARERVESALARADEDSA